MPNPVFLFFFYFFLFLYSLPSSHPDKPGPGHAKLPPVSWIKISSSVNSTPQKLVRKLKETKENKTSEHLIIYYTKCSCSQTPHMSCFKIGKVIRRHMYHLSIQTDNMASGSGICTSNFWSRQIRPLLSLTTGACGCEGREKRAYVEQTGREACHTSGW